MERRANTGTTRQDVAMLLTGDCDVYKPDGKVLCQLRRGALSAVVLEQAYPALHHLRKYTTDNRGAYSGNETSRGQMREDGRLSRQTRTIADGKVVQVASAIVGYYDRQGGRFPFCRKTAFTANEVDKWNTLLPMVREAAGVFKQCSPERYAAQLAATKKCAPDWIIPGTPFSTLTVNNNVVPAAIHKDKGDYKDGLGLISVSRLGSYSGAWLTFPEYAVAADLYDGDLIFFNSHEWHGVTPFEDAVDHERISVVYYFRERLLDCGTASQELERAKARDAL